MDWPSYKAYVDVDHRAGFTYSSYPRTINKLKLVLFSSEDTEALYPCRPEYYDASRITITSSNVSVIEFTYQPGPNGLGSWKAVLNRAGSANITVKVDGVVTDFFTITLTLA